MNENKRHTLFSNDDVVRIILQYLKESKYERSFVVLQEETSVSFNAIEDPKFLKKAVDQGQWDEVLRLVGGAQLTEESLVLLYEQIILELLEYGEIRLAFALLTETAAGRAMHDRNPEIYKKLENFVKTAQFDSRTAYGDLSKEKRRERVFNALIPQLKIVVPSRLITLLSAALKWQKNQGQLVSGGSVDLMLNLQARPESNNTPIDTLYKGIKFGKGSHPEVATFSPNGTYLISGSSDGLVEVWNANAGVLDTENLPYQQKGLFMAHTTAVLAMDVSSDSQMLACGTKAGDIKVWRISSGACVRTFERVHDAPISAVQFSRDGSNLLTSSFDSTVKIHGLRSARTLRVYRGHISHVNCVIYAAHEHKLVSGSSDGTIRIWDNKSTDCLVTVNPSTAKGGGEETRGINAICEVSSSVPPAFLASARSLNIYKINYGGQIIGSYSMPASDIVKFCIAPSNIFIYVVAENNKLSAIRESTGQVETEIKVHDAEVIGLAHHPVHNRLCTWGFDGLLNIMVSKEESI